jgi:hypothetical protein
MRSSQHQGNEASGERNGLPRFGGPLWDSVRNQAERLNENANETGVDAISSLASTIRSSFVTLGEETFPNKTGHSHALNAYEAMDDLGHECQIRGRRVPGYTEQELQLPTDSDVKLCEKVADITMEMNRLAERNRIAKGTHPATADERFEILRKVTELEFSSYEAQNRSEVGAKAWQFAEEMLDIMDPHVDLSDAVRTLELLQTPCRNVGAHVNLTPR